MSRVETRLTVVRALGKRMQATPLARIKVTDVCRDAGVSRATFYELFADIHDVGVWLWDHLMEDTLYQAGLTLGCQEAHERAFAALRGYREFFCGALKPVGYASVVQHSGWCGLEHCERVLALKAGRELNNNERLSLEFYVTGAKHMTRHWAERGMEEEPAVMAEVFVSAMPAFLREALEPPG